MTGLPLILVALLGIGAVMVLSLAWAFYQSPDKGFEMTTHRPEQLPNVMIDRYIAVGVIQIGLIFFGNLPMVAVFCIAGVIMGLGDGLIYARAGHPHWKHTSSGLLALIGLAVTLYYIAAGA